MKQTIALIDDDRNILTSISIALEKEGFNVQTYLDGESALIGLSRTPPDLAVVDIKMPKMDGEELLKKLRKKTSLPIIFLTSKDDEIDELLSLKLGADDFVKKSGGFSIKVLIERIRVQLRKKNINNIEDTKNIIMHGKLKLDPSQLECEWDGKQLPDKLTTTEFLIVVLSPTDTCGPIIEFFISTPFPIKHGSIITECSVFKELSIIFWLKIV